MEDYEHDQSLPVDTWNRSRVACNNILMNTSKTQNIHAMGVSFVEGYKQQDTNSICMEL